MTSHKPTVLITGATGQIGGDTLRNLLVTQTLSKSRSLAGLRVGLAVGHPDLYPHLLRLKQSADLHTTVSVNGKPCSGSVQKR